MSFAFSVVFRLTKFYTVCLIACILVVGFGIMLRSDSQVQQPPHQTIFRIFPVELWRKITKELHPKHLLTLRLVSTHMNSIVIHRVLHYYPLRIYINSSHIFPLTIGRKIITQLSSKDLKSLRLVSMHFNRLVIDTLYKRNHTNIFRAAVRDGDLKVMEYLFDLYKTDKQVQKEFIEDDMATGYPYQPCYVAAKHGHLAIIRKLYSWIIGRKEKQAMIESYFCPFRGAASHGHMEVMKQIYQWCKDDRKQAMIRIYDFMAFEYAACRDVRVAEQMWVWIDRYGREYLRNKKGLPAEWRKFMK